MNTISKKSNAYGYCMVDKHYVHIPIKYISLQLSNKSNFIKTENKCPYLFEGKCDLGNECQIFKDADNEL